MIRIINGTIFGQYTNPFTFYVQCMNNLLKILLISALVWGLASCNKEVVPEEPQEEEKTPTPTPTPTNPFNSQVETAKPTAVDIIETVNSNIGGFRASIPVLYSKTDKAYPLIIFIHGIGELGNGTTELSRVANIGISSLVTKKTLPASFKVNNENFSFIVVSPQFKKWPSADDVNALLVHVSKKYRIDPKRVYVSGCSMGGGVTWEFAAKYPAKVAAIVPICGAGSLNDAQAKALANNKVAVWAFHNKDDGTVTVNNTINNINKINSNKPTQSIIQTLWDTGGHDAWTKATGLTYKENNMNIYEWMLKQKRP